MNPEAPEAMLRPPAPRSETGAMLLLTFRIGNDLYALEARRAVEVLPLLALQRIPEAPRGVAGMFNYRGEPVVAVDLCELILGRAARPSLSTRIIVVNAAPQTGARRLLGLIAERATEVLRRDEREVTRPDPQAAAPYLCGVLMDARGMIQLLRPENLPFAALPDPSAPSPSAAGDESPRSPAS